MKRDNGKATLFMTKWQYFWDSIFLCNTSGPVCINNFKKANLPLINSTSSGSVSSFFMWTIQLTLMSTVCRSLVIKALVISHHGSLLVKADDLARYLSHCTEEVAHSSTMCLEIAILIATQQGTSHTTVVLCALQHQPLMVTYTGYKSNDSMCEKNGGWHSPHGALVIGRWPTSS